MKVAIRTIERADDLILRGEKLLEGIGKPGNIDAHDIWYADVRSFLSGIAPDRVQRLGAIASEYRDGILERHNGRAVYNLIIDQTQVLRFLRDEFELKNGKRDVTSPTIGQASLVAFEALEDAELLLSTRGPTSAVDRAHTALHAYLKQICINGGETISKDASLTDLFKILREKIDEFSSVIPHDEEAKRLFRSLASSVDTLNTLRNRGTIAHPNELLLEPAEAMLCINLSRALISYLKEKTEKGNG